MTNTRHPARRAVSAAVLAIAGLEAPLVPAQGQTASPPPESIRLDVPTKMLRDAGLAVAGSAGTGGFPNKCYSGLTVSNKLLADFVARGFSLTTLCLALGSYWVEYDPETGKPLTIVQGPGIGPLLIDIPDCLRNGTPYLDCTFNHGTVGEGKLPADSRRFWADRGPWIDAMMKKLKAGGRYTRECQCADLEMKLETDKAGRPMYTGAKPHFAIKAEAYCYVGTLPACAQSLSAGEVQTGFLFIDMPASVLYDLGFLDRNKDLLNENFEISPQLPRGYAHQFATPEGSDPTPFAGLSPGKVISVGSSSQAAPLLPALPPPKPRK